MSLSMILNGPIKASMYGSRLFRDIIHAREFGQKNLLPNTLIKKMLGKIGG